jgi:hypothetical protein
MNIQQKHKIKQLDNIETEGDDPSKTGTVPSDLDTEEALKHDNLHDDSSLIPDTPGKPTEND